VFIWKSGNQYCGNFFDDLREGYGEMYWKDGITYKVNLGLKYFDKLSLCDFRVIGVKEFRVEKGR
jgi:hypothetical protein